MLSQSQCNKTSNSGDVKQFTTFQLEKRKIDIDSLTVVKYIDETGQASSSYKISNIELRISKLI